MLNFSNATHFDWRDNAGNQSYPATIYNCAFNFSTNEPIKKIWFASPDYKGGASIEIPFTTNGDIINFSLPLIQYWDMIVVQYH